MGNKKNKLYRKKRKVVGKRINVSAQKSPEKDKDNLSTTPNVRLDISNCSSASSRKLVDITPSKPQRRATGYRIMDIELLSHVFDLFPCPSCHGQTISLTEKCAKKKGVAYIFVIICSSCDFEDFEANLVVFRFKISSTNPQHQGWLGCAWDNCRIF